VPSSEAANLIIGIVGNPGSGKTLLTTALAMGDLDKGIQAFSTYKISYKANELHVVYIDWGRLIGWLQLHAKRRFKMGSASLSIDEGYQGMDSRESSSKANRLLSYGLFQSRKLGLGNVRFNAQLATSTDKRIRRIADVWITCEAEPRPEFNGLTRFDADFSYTAFPASGAQPEEAYLRWEDALAKIIPYYNSMEIVQAPLIATDKNEAAKLQKELLAAAKETRLGEGAESERMLGELNLEAMPKVTTPTFNRRLASKVKMLRKRHK